MILVTGGTGFIGRRLVQKLVATYGAQSIECLVYNKINNINGLIENSGREILRKLGVRMVEGDLMTREGLDRLNSKPKIIYHLAACTETGDRDHTINNVGTLNLLRALTLGPGFRFIFTSTIAVSDHREDSDSPVTEETRLLKPYSEYGRKKLLTEDILKGWSSQKGFDLNIVRVSAVFGANPKKGGLYDGLAKLCRQNSILARLNYPGRIALVYVEDLAQCLVNLSIRPPGFGEIYTVIPTMQSLSVSELAQEIYKHLDIDYHPVVLPKFLWRFFSRGAKLIYWCERFIPHGIYNKLWQLSMLVNNNYYNHSVKTPEVFVDVKFKKFHDAVNELV